MKKSVKVMIVGVILFIGSLLFAVGGTVIGMIRSFNQIASSSQPNTEELAEWVSTSFTITMIGIPIAFLGLCLLIGGVIAYFVGKNKVDNKTNAETV